MTTTTLDTRAAGSERSWASLLAPLGGLGIVAGLIALLLSPAGDDAGETPAEVVAYASSHEGWSAAIAIFALLSLVLGGLFVAGLHARLQGITTATESALILIGGIAFTLCFALALTIWTAPLLDIPDDAGPRARVGGGISHLRRRRLVPARCNRGRRGPDGGSRVARGPPKSARSRRGSAGSASCSASRRSQRSRSSASSPGWRGSWSPRSRCCSGGGKRYVRASAGRPARPLPSRSARGTSPRPAPAGRRR